MPIATLGIDASLTGTGIAYIINNMLIQKNRLNTKSTGVKRLIEIEDKLKASIDSFAPNLVLIEGYAYAAQNQAHQIGELGGVIRRMLHKSMVPWIEVAPSQVKKFATGKGNAKKELIIMNVYKKWGVEFTPGRRHEPGDCLSRRRNSRMCSAG
jgi:crossover junction endodeoxyribonuclease RuvC